MSECIEKKKKLTGQTQIFPCELIRLKQDYGLLKYIIPRSYRVAEVFLPVDSITYAFYWPDRPYTLYRWYRSSGALLGNYFNIADQVRLTPAVFSWRDLIIDVLITPQGNLTVLDQDELVAPLEPQLKRYINNAKSLIINNYKDILNKTDKILEYIKNPEIN